RPVDLATLPLYARAGAIVPLDPVRQYVSQPADGPATLHIYRGTDGRFTLYDDDGRSLAYRDDQGSWTNLTWHDRERRLGIGPDPRSAAKGERERVFDVLILPEKVRRRVTFTGKRLEVTF